MKCKNCGSDFVPGVLRCPTCNVPYAESDALEIPDIPKEDLTLPVLPEGEIGDVKIEDDNVVSQPKATEVTSTMIEIVPIAAPKTEQGYKDELLPLEKVVVDDNPLSHAKQMLPPKEDRGSNVLFIFFGILLLVGGAGFFIYINYIDKDFIDNLINEMNQQSQVVVPTQEEIPTKEETIVVKESVSKEELEKYIKDNATKIEVEELMNLKLKLVSSITNLEEYDKVEMILYKEEKTSNDVLSSPEKKIKAITDTFVDTDTFKVEVVESTNTLLVIITKNISLNEELNNNEQESTNDN